MLVVWIAAASVCAGAALGASFSPPAFILVTATVGMASLVFAPRRIVAFAGVSLLSCAGGIAVARSVSAPGELPAVARSVPQCDLEGRVIERAGGLGTLIDVTLTSCDRARGVAVVDGAVGEAGGSVAGRAWVLPLGEDGFGWARRHAGARVHLVGDVIVVARPTSPLLAAAARVRQLLRDATAALPADRGGLLLGLTIGETDRLDPWVVDDFRRSGLAHLVAVSGSNVALVLGTVVVLARRASARLRLILCAATLLLYVLVVGPDAPVLRAAAMAALTLVALARGRAPTSLATLAVAIIVIVVFRPGIVFSAGFHLSVAATVGIILLAPAIARTVPGPRALVLLLAATIGAQVAVAPVLLATFGEISLIAPVANLLAAPAVAVTTISGLLGGLISDLIPQVAPLVIAVADLGARWILGVARLSAGIPGAAVTLPAPAALGGLGLALVVVRWARNVTGEMAFMWAVLDADGKEIDRTEAFGSKDEAEAWMGSEWSSLLERGGESVVLYEDDTRHYQMGLREA